jgi:hypothetical protein
MEESAVVIPSPKEFRGGLSTTNLCLSALSTSYALLSPMAIIGCGTRN